MSLKLFVVGFDMKIGRVNQYRIGAHAKRWKVCENWIARMYLYVYVYLCAVEKFECTVLRELGLDFYHLLGHGISVLLKFMQYLKTLCRKFKHRISKLVRFDSHQKRSVKFCNHKIPVYSLWGPIDIHAHKISGLEIWMKITVYHWASWM